MSPLDKQPVRIKLEFPTEDMPHPLPQVGDDVIMRGTKYGVTKLEWNFDDKNVYVICDPRRSSAGA